MPALPGGSCNGATSVFGSVHCQAAQNSAGGDLQATSSLVSYWPYLAAGGLLLLIIALVGLFLCCRAKVKADATKNVFRRELIALSTKPGHVRPPSYDV
ncbi:P10 [Pycnonotidae orthoreovirus]|uniref:P10 n=1 Tax=Pycnonotidae orthoreovirus TaxID=3070176 RepID=A0A0B6VIH8_9REOV|nr:P10 [Avian orthoreovirus]BAQ19499.1 P10 [Avian orthoreovirus]